MPSDTNNPLERLKQSQRELQERLSQFPVPREPSKLPQSDNSKEANPESIGEPAPAISQPSLAPKPDIAKRDTTKSEPPVPTLSPAQTNEPILPVPTTIPQPETPQPSAASPKWESLPMPTSLATPQPVPQRSSSLPVLPKPTLVPPPVTSSAIPHHSSSPKVPLHPENQQHTEVTSDSEPTESDDEEGTPWQEFFRPSLALIPFFGTWLAWKHVKNKNEEVTDGFGTDENLPDAAIIYKYWVYGLIYSVLIVFSPLYYIGKPMEMAFSWIHLPIGFFFLVLTHAFIVSKVFSLIFDEDFSMSRGALVTLRMISGVLVYSVLMTLIGFLGSTIFVVLAILFSLAIIIFLLCIAVFSIDIHYREIETSRLLGAGLSVTVALAILSSIFLPSFL